MIYALVNHPPLLRADGLPPGRAAVLIFDSSAARGLAHGRCSTVALALHEREGHRGPG